MKLCVFSNDSIQSYYNKGEIKPRYFNPKDFFEEVHIVSTAETEVDEKKVSSIVGTADLKIHAVGKTNLLNYKSKLGTVIKLIDKIKPDVIRSYNPLIQGWLAAKSAEHLRIPFVLSVHNNYDKDVRQLNLKDKKYLKYLKLGYTSKFIEPYVIKSAVSIICAYRFLIPYVERLGGKKIQVIYNKVNLTKFSPEIESKYKFDVTAIIYVARLDKEKNQECLIKAIKELNVKLLLIGDGPDYDGLIALSKKLGIGKKIIFIKSVPNELLGKYYNSADIFAAPIKQGGISIPMLEAMASGLPIIASEREMADEKEDVDDVIMFVKNEPNSFRDAIKKLEFDENLRKKMIKKGLENIKLINGDLMEQKEALLYKNVLASK